MSIRAQFLLVALVLTALMLCFAAPVGVQHLPFGTGVCSASAGKPPTAARFYAHVSAKLLAAELPKGETLGGEPHNKTQIEPHLEWAKKAHRHEMKLELIRKFDLMVGIKRKQGKKQGTGKQPLARWYAKVCTTWDGYGVEFTGPARVQVDAGAYKNWVKNEGTPKKIKNRLERRIDEIFKSYGAGEYDAQTHVPSWVTEAERALPEAVHELLGGHQKPTGYTIHSVETVMRSTGQVVHRVAVFDLEEQETRKFCVSSDGNIVRFEDLVEAEKEAYAASYGKLSEDLSERARAYPDSSFDVVITHQVPALPLRPGTPDEAAARRQAVESAIRPNGDELVGDITEGGATVAWRATYSPVIRARISVS